jgi:hypothetical protein
MKLPSFRRSGLFLALLLCALPSSALASGSYSGRPPRPPESESRTLYLIGKNIFNGKTRLDSSGNSAEYHGELIELQKKLPSRAGAKVDLPKFSGMLSARQFMGLKHYLSVRYKVQ